MTYALEKISDHPDYSPSVGDDGIRINLASSFICFRIPGHPQMRFEACTARKQRCDENDEQHIRNTFSECRGCPGYASMRIAAPPMLEYKSRNQLSYHTKECRCCGRMITATDQHPTFGKGICHHCKRGLVAADEIGLEQGKAVEAIRYYAHLYSGKKKAAVYHNQTWTVRFEAYFQGEGMPKKVDRCSCCGRSGLQLRNKHKGKYICGTCDYHIRKGRSVEETKMRTQGKPVLVRESKEKHQVNVEPEVDIIPTQKRNRKDPPMMRLPITEREQPVLDWIDKLARENRRDRRCQVWALLEALMEDSIDLAEISNARQ